MDMGLNMDIVSIFLILIRFHARHYCMWQIRVDCI